MVYERTEGEERHLLFTVRGVLHISRDARLVDVIKLTEDETQALLGQHDWRQR